MPSGAVHPWENIVPFHKLTQWLCYSLMVPMTKLLNAHFVGVHLMTGLPEYRNGGLIIDTGLITLKKEDMDRGLKQYNDNATKMGQPCMEVVPMFTPDDDVIVEWRAITVGFLDMIHDKVNEELGLEDAAALNLAQVLEAGTWKVSRLCYLMFLILEFPIDWLFFFAQILIAPVNRVVVKLLRSHVQIPRSPLS
jgi:hypothetical protein